MPWGRKRDGAVNRQIKPTRSPTQIAGAINIDKINADIIPCWFLIKMKLKCLTRQCLLVFLLVVTNNFPRPQDGKNLKNLIFFQEVLAVRNKKPHVLRGWVIFWADVNSQPSNGTTIVDTSEPIYANFNEFKCQLRMFCILFGRGPPYLVHSLLIWRYYCLCHSFHFERKCKNCFSIPNVGILNTDTKDIYTWHGKRQLIRVDELQNELVRKSSQETSLQNINYSDTCLSFYILVWLSGVLARNISFYITYFNYPT